MIIIVLQWKFDHCWSLWTGHNGLLGVFGCFVQSMSDYYQQVQKKNGLPEVTTRLLVQECHLKLPEYESGRWEILLTKKKLWCWTSSFGGNLIGGLETPKNKFQIYRPINNTAQASLKFMWPRLMSADEKSRVKSLADDNFLTMEKQVIMEK